MKIAYLHASPKYWDNRIFDLNESPRDNIFEPFVQLKKYLESKTHLINTHDYYSIQDKIDILIVNRFGFYLREIFNIINNNPQIRIIYRVSEEENIEPLHNKYFLKNTLFDAIITFRDDMVDGKYFLKYFYQSPFSIFQNNIAFSDKKYLTIINSYKYQKNKNPSDLYGDRIKAIKYFASESDIDLYGVGWDKCKSDTILSFVTFGSYMLT